MEIFELPCNFGSNLRKLAKGNSVNMVNSDCGRHLTTASFYRVPVAAVTTFGFVLARRRLMRGFFILPGRVLSRRSRRSPPFHFLCFSRRHRRCSVELTPSPKHLYHLSKVCLSSAYSLRTHPTEPRCLILPRTATRCLSSSRPVASPSRALQRGRRSTVSRCSCEVLFQLRHDAGMLCALLLDHFVHRSHWSTIADVVHAAMIAVTDDEFHRCFFVLFPTRACLG